MQTIRTIDRLFYRELGEQFRKRRKQLGMTLKDVSRITGYSRSLIDHIELGCTKVNDFKLDKICEALQISNNISVDVKVGFWEE